MPFSSRTFWILASSSGCAFVVTGIYPDDGLTCHLLLPEVCMASITLLTTPVADAYVNGRAYN